MVIQGMLGKNFSRPWQFRDFAAEQFGVNSANIQHHRSIGTTSLQCHKVAATLQCCRTLFVCWEGDKLNKMYMGQDSLQLTSMTLPMACLP